MPLQDDFQREERRSILLVGLSIIVLALIVSPVGSFLTSSLALLGAFWVIYALGMLIYFSDDLFHPRTRRTARVIGLTSFFVYPVAVILAVLSAAAAAFMLPYASIINWAMVAVGTSYAILIGGRVLRFQQAQHVAPILTNSTSTLDEINAVFHTAAIKASRPKQSLSTIVEKIPRPAIIPIMPLLPTPTGGVVASAPPALPRRTRKLKVDDSSAPKKPLGQTSPRKTPQQTGANNEHR